VLAEGVIAVEFIVIRELREFEFTGLPAEERISRILG